MPLQNRVTPFGEIIATPEHGMFMGNRGVLHNRQRHLVRQFSSQKAWIICLTQFRGRKRELMAPGRYTELFFLDEATALAAGHRPCGECRRASFRQFKAAWLAGNPDAGVGSKPGIAAIDKLLHDQRLTAAGGKRTYPATLGQLPDGTFVQRPSTDDALLLWQGGLHRWAPSGYEGAQPAGADEIVEVLTPSSTVNALQAGYQPAIHTIQSRHLDPSCSCPQGKSEFPS